MVFVLTLALMLDLSSVQNEPNLEKRSELAMKAADQAVGTARKAYEQGHFEEATQALTEVREAIELSYESLIATGKNPRKDSKYFKRAEKATRDLLRRLTSLRDLMSSVDHEIIDPVIERANSIQDNLVTGVLTGQR